MSLPVVVDAALVVKWLLPEAQSSTAVELLKALVDRNLQLAAPLVIEAEVANILNRQSYIRNLLPEEVEQAWNAFVGLEIDVQQPPQLHHLAFDIAARMNRSSIYDSYYVALSELLRCEYWTGNRRLYIASQVRFPQLRWLGDFTVEQPIGVF